MSPTKIESSVHLLHPMVVGKFLALEAALAAGFRAGETKTRFRIFETYRSPQRQRHLYLNTTSTKAEPWESPHQYGLAADFVPDLSADDAKRQWSWDDTHDWAYLSTQARKVGLQTPIKWDRAHVEASSLLRAVRAAYSG